MKKLIVIGGGFAGSEIARKLENKFEVTLVDTKDYFEFTPWILRAIVSPWQVKEIQISHTKYLRKAKLVVGKVSSISEKSVVVGKKKIAYDYLAICSGSRYDSPFKEQNVVAVSRADHLKANYEALCEAREIVVVGGGLVGVELAAEIIGFYSDKSLVIVHSGSRLIERNSEKAIAYAERYLKERGARILYGERVVEIKRNSCETDKGTKLKADLIFLCTGIKPNCEFLESFNNILQDKMFVKVNEFLQVDGFKNIFAAGDIVSIKEEKTAQNAERQAKVVVENILALEFGRKMARYSSKRTPQVISLGRFDGIYDDGKIFIAGLLPAFLKWAIKKKEIWKKRF